MVFGVTGTLSGFGALTGPGASSDPARVADPAGDAEATAAVLALFTPSSFVTLPSGARVYNRDLLAEEPQLVSTRPQTVVYKIRAVARWSDGMPISAADYVYQWRIHNRGACPGCGLADHGYSAISSVTGSDNGKTVTVTFREPYAQWRALFGTLLPAHVAAARSAGLETASGLAASVAGWAARPEWSGGPYLISAYRRDSQLELVPNERWYGAQAPTLEKLVFRFFASRSSALDALERGDLDGLRMLPDTAAADRIRAIVAASGGAAPSRRTASSRGAASATASDPGETAASRIGYQLSAGRDWVHLDLNAAQPSLADVTLRQAIFVAVDANEIAESAIGRILPGSSPRASHNLVPGRPGYRDVLRGVTPVQGAGDPQRAGALLTGAGYQFGDGTLITPAGTPVPPLRLRYATDDPARAAVADLVRAAAAKLGLTVVIEPVGDLAATLRDRDFELLLRDENEPAVGVPLGPDRWRAAADGDLLGWHNAESEALLARAAGELDDVRRCSLLNQQDEIMTRDAVVLPLYQRPSLLAADTRYVNLRDNPASGDFTYNAAQWGVSAPD